MDPFKVVAWEFERVTYEVGGRRFFIESEYMHTLLGSMNYINVGSLFYRHGRQVSRRCDRTIQAELERGIRHGCV